MYQRLTLVSCTKDGRISKVRLTFNSSVKNLRLFMVTKLWFRENINNLRNILNVSLKKLLCKLLVLSRFNNTDATYSSCILHANESRIGTTFVFMIYIRHSKIAIQVI